MGDCISLLKTSHQFGMRRNENKSPSDLMIRHSSSLKEKSHEITTASHRHWNLVTWCIGRPAGVDGDVVGVLVLRLGLNVLGLHVLTGHRAGTMGKGR